MSTTAINQRNERVKLSPFIVGMGLVYQVPKKGETATIIELMKPRMNDNTYFHPKYECIHPTSIMILGCFR